MVLISLAAATALMPFAADCTSTPPKAAMQGESMVVSGVVPASVTKGYGIPLIAPEGTTFPPGVATIKTKDGATTVGNIQVDAKGSNVMIVFTDEAPKAACQPYEFTLKTAHVASGFPQKPQAVAEDKGEDSHAGTILIGATAVAAAAALGWLLASRKLRIKRS